ncbi:hypothetical protein FACS18949_09200 [Clostridia bacterium]|nr:hypothetical protein FACS18949_09200 [Clostridia bacterium]
MSVPDFAGDVWLCAGQSNMELWLGRVKHMYPDVMSVNNPNIRQFKVPQEYDFDAPRGEVSGEWVPATPENITDFTAVGYFFANNLWEKYRKPIGLLSAAVGGTPIHAWLANRAELSNADAEKIQNADAARIEQYYYKLDQAESPDGEWKTGDIRDIREADPGIVWFRKIIDIPEQFAGKPADVFLGTLVDGDSAYLNGEFIGGTGYRFPPREYHINALPSGRCELTVRVVSCRGDIHFTRDKPRLLVCEGRLVSDLNGEWEYRRAATSEWLEKETEMKYKPSGLYNGMIHPLRNVKIKGVIWYQGESDAGNAEGYAEKFAQMVDDWRKLWGNIPVIAVELTDYSEDYGWAALRREQLKALSIPNTALVMGYDLGEHNDLHPLNKKTVGDRLARAARRLVYGESMPNSPYEVLSPCP